MSDGDDEYEYEEEIDDDQKPARYAQHRVRRRRLSRDRPPPHDNKRKSLVSNHPKEEAMAMSCKFVGKNAALASKKASRATVRRR